MRTARSASRTCSASSSAVEYTATASMPSSCSARMTRTAISPRFATRTRVNTRRVYGRGVEAPLEKTELGLVCTGDGWFVANLTELRWRRRGENLFSNVAGDVLFDQLGIGISILAPGQPMSMYHWESDQEDFLIVSGTATLVIDGEERALKQWDFVHCPPHTAHVIVG